MLFCKFAIDLWLHFIFRTAFFFPPSQHSLFIYLISVSVFDLCYFHPLNLVVLFLQSGLQRLRDYPQPFWLALFVEGTRFTQAKLLAAQEYAVSTGLSIPRNVLIPRTKVDLTSFLLSLNIFSGYFLHIPIDSKIKTNILLNRSPLFGIIVFVLLYNPSELYFVAKL